eukprot:TRINITY_DN736_c0_g1_i1.p1 TRINITY_DN736_c0_g1~~TRINITY_DN736_c0_g1_i1.p1  ORF type:complete len:228 (+),score=47.66 TRINITY_DN736_c0_g1_i1:50-733(+)
MAGAEYYQSIFGTEKDKVNCPFYFKMGACRHGDQCERKHLKPTLSQTLLLSHMYTNPLLRANFSEKRAQEDYDDFYEDVYSELIKYGDIDEMHVCDNICEHLLGNVYVKFFREGDADKALKSLTGRFYGGRPVVAEFSPVTDFREASCRQYENRECTRGGHCNFMHLKQITRELHKYLFYKRKQAAKIRDRDKKRSRSRSPRKERRSRSRSPKKGRRDDFPALPPNQ